MKDKIPVYDIGTIDQRSQNQLLIERFGQYLEKHYAHLHRPHRRSFYHLVLFTKGKGSHTIDFERFDVRPFQVYFMIPGQVHSWHFEEGVAGYIVHFQEQLFRSFLQNHQYLDNLSFFRGHAAQSVCQLPPQWHGTVVDIFEALLSEIQEEKAYNLDLIRLKLLEFFILVERHCTQTGKPAPRQKHMLLQNFQQLINRYYKTVRPPKEYADLLYVTPNHLNALCTELLNKTAGDLIRERILLEVKRLLTNADLTVTEVAYELNFQDNSYFNRFFKKYEGMTPDAFRKQFIQT